MFRRRLWSYVSGKRQTSFEFFRLSHSSLTSTFLSQHALNKRGCYTQNSSDQSPSSSVPEHVNTSTLTSMCLLLNSLTSTHTDGIDSILCQFGRINPLTSYTSNQAVVLTSHSSCIGLGTLKIASLPPLPIHLAHFDNCRDIKCYHTQVPQHRQIYAFNVILVLIVGPNAHKMAAAVGFV